MLGVTRVRVIALAAVLVGLGTGVVPVEATAAPRSRPRDRPRDREITVTHLVDGEGRPLVQPQQINERGQVLARIEGPQMGWARYWHHALWYRGEATLIEVPSTSLPPDQAAQIMTMPFEVSETGHIVGMRTHIAVYPVWPFLWVDGEYTPLLPESMDSFPPDPAFLTADINERGQILAVEFDRDPPPSFDSEISAVVLDEDGELLARNDADGYPVDVDNRGHALLDVADVQIGAFRAGVWDFGGSGAVSDLGTLGGASSRGMAMNVQGHVAGVSQTASGAEHAFRWADGEMTDLGTLGGTTSKVGHFTDILPVLQRTESTLNAWGDVVGWSTTASGAEHAVLWRNGRTIDLGTLGGTNSRAAAINELGQVVGWAETASGQRHAFLWQAGRMVDLGALDMSAPGSSSEAVDVNNRGQVLGSSGGEAVLWAVPLLPRP